MTTKKVRKTSKRAPTAAQRAATAAQRVATAAAAATLSPEAHAIATGAAAPLVVGTPASGAPAGTGNPPAAGSDQGPSAAVIAAAQGPAVPGGATDPAGTPVGTSAGTHTTARASRAVSPVSKLRKPMGDQVLTAAAMAMEIRRSAANGSYRTLFGVHAPDPEALALAVERAGQLSQEEIATRTAWQTVRDERNTAWDVTFTQAVDPFKACFALAEAHNPSMVNDFPSTKAFLRTNAQIGARGAATRKVNRAAKG